MEKQDRIIVVKVSRSDGGLYSAASTDLPGVCVTHRDPKRIIDDMPNIIKLWFRRNHNVAVEVFQGRVRQTDHEYSIPAMTVPAEIAAAALGG